MGDHDQKHLVALAVERRVFGAVDLKDWSAGVVMA
jgi:hypothetical protein